MTKDKQLNKREFLSRVANTLRLNNARKPVKIPKQVFHISDDDGNYKNFTVKKADKAVLYTVGDVESIIEACLVVLCDALKNGESVAWRGFGSIGVQKRKGRRVMDLNNPGQFIDTPDKYCPKVNIGYELKRSAELHGLIENDLASTYIDDEDGEE